eukprot:5919328-Pyramimonas_sp.AAC.1
MVLATPQGGSSAFRTAIKCSLTRGRVTGVLSAPLPSSAQEDPRNEAMLHTAQRSGSHKRTHLGVDTKGVGLDTKGVGVDTKGVGVDTDAPWWTGSGRACACASP